MEISLTFVLVIALALIIFFSWIMYKIGFKQATYKKDLEWQENLVSIRGKIADNQRANIKGKVAEAFAPFLPDFPFKPSECKFIGDPIDYLVFEGLDDRDIRGVHLL